MRVVVSWSDLENRPELRLRLGQAADAEVGDAERLADRGLARLAPLRLLERDCRLRGDPVLADGSGPAGRGRMRRSPSHLADAVKRGRNDRSERRSVGAPRAAHASAQSPGPGPAPRASGGRRRRPCPLVRTAPRRAPRRASRTASRALARPRAATSPTVAFGSTPRPLVGQEARELAPGRTGETARVARQVAHAPRRELGQAERRRRASEKDRGEEHEPRASTAAFASRRAPLAALAQQAVERRAAGVESQVAVEAGRRGDRAQRVGRVGRGRIRGGEGSPRRGRVEGQPAVPGNHASTQA